MENFDGFQFPIVKKVGARTLADDIKSEKPMSLEDAIAGRKVVELPYDVKYVMANTIDDLVNMIERVLMADKKLKTEWLETSHSNHMPLNTSSEIYNPSYLANEFTCYYPKTSKMQDIIYGTKMSFDPKVISIEMLETAINIVKNKTK